MSWLDMYHMSSDLSNTLLNGSVPREIGNLTILTLLSHSLPPPSAPYLSSSLLSSLPFRRPLFHSLPSPIYPSPSLPAFPLALSSCSPCPISLHLPPSPSHTIPPSLSLPSFSRCLILSSPVLLSSFLLQRSESQ
ncbi:unnamed protein product [Closterium sp. NIES-64]|nr:unnamed protein product [Closterium sp. NIES-64]